VSEEARDMEKIVNAPRKGEDSSITRQIPHTSRVREEVQQFTCIESWLREVVMDCQLVRETSFERKYKNVHACRVGCVESCSVRESSVRRSTKGKKCQKKHVTWRRS